MSGLSGEEAEALGKLICPIALRIAALLNLLSAKGLVSAEEVQQEMNRLDKEATLKQLERDLGGA